MLEQGLYQEQLSEILINLLGIITNWNKKVTICIASMLITPQQMKPMIEYIIENKDNKESLREDLLLQTARKIMKQ